MAEDRARATSRRGFLAGGAALATGPALAETPDPDILTRPPWAIELGAGVGAHPYGQPSPFEGEVIRRTVDWLTPDPFSSVSFTPIHALEGTITPNGLCFERHHSGVPSIDPAHHRLMVMGDVARPLVFTMADLLRFPRETRTYFLECAANSGMEWRGAQLNGCQFTQGMIHNVAYTGIRLGALLDAAGVTRSDGWVLAEGDDAAQMTRSIPMEKAREDCLVAFAMNGEALRPEQGYPLRLVVPGWEGAMWIKWLKRLEVGDGPWAGREETSKYTDLMPGGTARQHTFVMDAKSVITSPSPQRPITHGAGPMVLTGLAWSGHGAISRVDVTLDGGRNWQTARLDGPPRPKALSRFYYDFDWDGAPMLLQSRAIDETGYVQPTKDSLRAIRGVNSIYHMNGIQTWSVNAAGEVENVEIS